MSACPTFTLLGDEADSPRGRIYLMKALADGRVEPTSDVLTHLDRCLDCRACETACPAGVQYGSLIESARAQMHDAGLSGNEMGWFVRFFVKHVFPYPARLEKALMPVRWMQRLGLVEKLPGRLGAMARMLPLLPRPKIRLQFPHYMSAVESREARVGLLTGCVTSVMYSPLNVATAQVLALNGCDVYAPNEQSCCGALFAHTGDKEEAKVCARRNIDIFEELDLDAIIVNAAGCGCTMKEYGELLHDDPYYAERAKVFVLKVRDFTEFLASRMPLTPPSPIEARVTYHDPCHLAHGQGIVDAPRELLKAVPGLEIVDMADSDACCGSAGIYNVAQPELAEQILQRKIDNVENTGAEMLVTANPGCMLQLADGIQRRGLACEVIHMATLFSRAYGL